MIEYIAILIEYILHSNFCRSGEFPNLSNFRSTEHIHLILHPISLQILSVTTPHCFTVSPMDSSLLPSPRLCRLDYIHVQVTKSSTHVDPVASVKNPHCHPQLHVILVPSSDLLLHPQSGSSCCCSSSSSSSSFISTSQTTASKACRRAPLEARG